MIATGEKKEEYRNSNKYWSVRFNKFVPGRDTVTFSHGYAKNRRQMVVELISFGYGTGRTEWGAQYNVRYYKLYLGKIISKNF